MLGLSGRDGIGRRESVFQPTERPVPRFLLEANAKFHEAISDALGCGEFMGKFVLDLLQLLCQSGTHATLRIVTAIIRRVPPKIKMNSGLIESEAWKTVNPVEIVGKNMHAVFCSFCPTMVQMAERGSCL